MTTARQIIDRAMTLLGYTDRYGAPDSEKYAAEYRMGLDITNQLVSDLCRIERIDFVELENVDDTITLSEVSRNDVLPYGVAMYLAKNAGDGTNEGFFATMYSQKRRLVPCPKTSISRTYGFS